MALLGTEAVVPLLGTADMRLGGVCGRGGSGIRLIGRLEAGMLLVMGVLRLGAAGILFTGTLAGRTVGRGRLETLLVLTRDCCRLIVLDAMRLGLVARRLTVGRDVRVTTLRGVGAGRPPRILLPDPILFGISFSF